MFDFSESQLPIIMLESSEPTEKFSYFNALNVAAAGKNKSTSKSWSKKTEIIKSFC